MKNAVKQRPLGHKAAGRRYSGNRKRAYHGNDGRVGHLAGKAAQLCHAPCAGLQNNGSGHHEEYRFAQAVRDVKHGCAGHP